MLYIHTIVSHTILLHTLRYCKTFVYINFLFLIHQPKQQQSSPKLLPMTIICEQGESFPSPHPRTKNKHQISYSKFLFLVSRFTKQHLLIEADKCYN